MAKKLKLPEVKTQDIQSGYLSIRPEDLKLSFSVVTLRAGDAAEKAFRETLLNSEDDLKELEHEPMAFPVFGRGRALNALVTTTPEHCARDSRSNPVRRACSAASNLVSSASGW